MSHPIELIKLINEKTPIIKNSRKMAVFPMSPKETICYLVLERVGFDVSPVRRSAKAQRSDEPNGLFSSVEVTALHVKNKKWDCIVDIDGGGNEDQHRMLMWRVMQTESLSSSAHFNGPWQPRSAYPPDHECLVEIAATTFIDQLVALCQAHMLQSDTEPSVAQLPRRRI